MKILSTSFSYKDGKARGQVYYKDDEHSKRRNKTKVFKGNKRETREEFAAWVDELKAKARKFTPNRIITVQHYINDKIEKQNALGHVERSTISGYVKLANYINESLGDKLLAEITQDDIESLMLEMLERGLSPNTVRRTFSRVKHYMNEALNEGLIEENPCARLKPPKAQEQERVAMSKAGRLRLVSLLDQLDNDEVTIAVLIALHTGMRSGEICALRWSCFDVKRADLAYIQIKEAIGKETKGGFYLKTPKSRASNRVIPVVDTRFIARLNSVKSAQQQECMKLGIPFSENLFILGGVDGSYMKPDTLQKRFRVYRDILSLKNAKGEPLHLHELRHTYATEAIAAGVDIEAAAAILGHSKPSTTLDIYGHVRPESKLAAAEKMSEILKEKPQSAVIIPFQEVVSGE